MDLAGVIVQQWVHASWSAKSIGHLGYGLVYAHLLFNYLTGVSQPIWVYFSRQQALWWSCWRGSHQELELNSQPPHCWESPESLCSTSILTNKAMEAQKSFIKLTEQVKEYLSLCRQYAFNQHILTEVKKEGWLKLALCLTNQADL